MIDMMHLYGWKPATTLTITLMVYLIGLMRLSRKGALSHVPKLEIASFLAGWIVLAGALLSPIATLSEWLFSVHMTQHEVLMLVAAPLIAMGRPLVPMLWVLPERWRRAPSAVAGRGAIATLTSPPIVSSRTRWHCGSGICHLCTKRPSSTIAFTSSNTFALPPLPRCSGGA